MTDDELKAMVEKLLLSQMQTDEQMKRTDTKLERLEERSVTYNRRPQCTAP